MARAQGWLYGPGSPSPGQEGWEDTPPPSSPWTSLPGPKQTSVGKPGLSLWARAVGEAGTGVGASSVPPTPRSSSCFPKTGQGLPLTFPRLTAHLHRVSGPWAHLALRGVGRWPGCTLAGEALPAPPGVTGVSRPHVVAFLVESAEQLLLSAHNNDELPLNQSLCSSPADQRELGRCPRTDLGECSGRGVWDGLASAEPCSAPRRSPPALTCPGSGRSTEPFLHFPALRGETRSQARLLLPGSRSS